MFPSWCADQSPWWGPSWCPPWGGPARPPCYSCWRVHSHFIFRHFNMFCFLDVLISLLCEDHPGILPHRHGVLHGEDQHVLHVVVTEGCTLSLFWGTWIYFLLDGLISLLGEDHPGVLPHSHGLLTVVVEHAVVTFSFLLVNDGVHVHCREL